MTSHALVTVWQPMAPAQEVVGAVCTADGPGERCAVDAVDAHHGPAQLAVDVAEAAVDEEEGTGPVRRAAAAAAWLDLGACRGLTAAEPARRWHALACRCDVSGQTRQGPLDEASTPRLADGEQCWR